MVTKLAIVLRKKPNKEGLYPLAIRITTNRIPKYRQIDVYLKLEHWDDQEKIVKPSHPEADCLNEFIAEKLLKARRHLNSIKEKSNDEPVFKSKKKSQKPIKPTFFEIAQQFLDEFEEAENFSRLSSEKSYVGYVKKFHKSKSLAFEEINESFLKKFKAYLKKKHSLKEVSIMNIFVMIRTLYNRAIKQRIVKRKFYPFGKDKIKIKFPETQKIGLNIDEIKTLESLTDLTFDERHALNLWLYSFYFAGIRVSDVLKARWSAFKNGRMYYTMGKNSKLVSLQVPLKVIEILKGYKKDKRNANDYIFPELKIANHEDPKDVYRVFKLSSKKINNHLKNVAKKANIEKKLTMHIARHSFGHIAGETIHPKKLQKLYRHSNLQTTIGYQANFIHSDADEALNNVINF